jgi:hypothetical protein
MKYSVKYVICFCAFVLFVYLLPFLSLSYNDIVEKDSKNEISKAFEEKVYYNLMSDKTIMSNKLDYFSNEKYNLLVHNHDRRLVKIIDALEDIYSLNISFAKESDSLFREMVVKELFKIQNPERNGKDISEDLIYERIVWHKPISFFNGYNYISDQNNSSHNIFSKSGLERIQKDAFGFFGILPTTSSGIFEKYYSELEKNYQIYLEKLIKIVDEDLNKNSFMDDKDWLVSDFDLFSCIGKDE